MAVDVRFGFLFTVYSTKNVSEPENRYLNNMRSCFDNLFSNKKLIIHVCIEHNHL